MSINRRQALRTLANGFGMFGAAQVLGASALSPKGTHFPARAKNVIFLFLNGGVSHVDTFDPKPMLTKFSGTASPGGNLKTERKTGNLMGSPFRFQRYGKSGIEVSEVFPRIGERIDNFAVLRSMTTDIPNHPPAMLMMSCGRNVLGAPSMGSWITYGLGTVNQNLPGYVVLCPGRPVTVGSQMWTSSFLPGVYQGTHVMNGKGADTPEKLIPFLQNARTSGDEQAGQLSLLRGLNAAHQTQRPGDPELEASIESMEMAYRMQSEATDAFDLRKEKEATRERYGTTPFAKGCLLARRLVERGVRVVQVFFEAGEPWDHHADIMLHSKLGAMADQPIAALVDDLKANGLFEETLILIGGEFGRTPTAEISVRQFLQNGRDHDPYGFTMLLAGGGVKGGITYGATDELGWKAVEKPMHVHDLHATMLHQLGLDHTRLTYHYSGRDYRLTDVAGEVVKEIIA